MPDLADDERRLLSENLMNGQCKLRRFIPGLFSAWQLYAVGHCSVGTGRRGAHNPCGACRGVEPPRTPAKPVPSTALTEMAITWLLHR